jgi:transposase InsO family protein
VRFEFIHAEEANFPIQILCRVLEVSRSGYYRWVHAEPSAHSKRDQRLTVEIKAIHSESRGTYGSPRVHAELQAKGFEVGRNRVARLMAEQGITGRRPPRFCKTTNSCHDHPIAPNLIERDFSPAAPNEVWAADITYIPTASGWAYLAVVLDLFSRRVIGWAIADHMRTELVLEALDRALGTRDVGEELIHHSDRGSQYASNRHREELERRGISCSMSAKGCCYDNAVVESFFATLKKELVYRTNWLDANEATLAISEYIQVFYNGRRRHSTLGYVSPSQFEARHASEVALAA